MAWFSSLSPEQRVDRAVHIVSRAIDQLQEIIGVSEVNRIIVYSPAVASRIPQSYAANTFTLIQWITLNYEILRLCALWDRGASDRESVPAIIELVDSPLVLALVSRRLCESESVLSPNSYVKQHVAHLQKAIRVAKKISQATFRKALVEFRDARLAHSLTPQANPTQAKLTLKYGYERRLLTASIAIVNAINGALRNSTFAFEMSFENSKRNAEAFWLTAKFSATE